MSKRYYQMTVDGPAREAEVLIFGDITSMPWMEGDVSAFGLAQELGALADVDRITVRINSYGGEVAEGVAIYNALCAHPAAVRTVCEGFACSIASVIFMAGEERVMNEASLLMIHNAWCSTSGNADELRREADDLDSITALSKRIYLAGTDLSEEELSAWMDAETFIDAETALARGFATEVAAIGGERAAQAARASVAGHVMRCQRALSLAAAAPGEGFATGGLVPAGAIAHVDGAYVQGFACTRARMTEDGGLIIAACEEAGIEDAEPEPGEEPGEDGGDEQAAADEAELACRMAQAYLDCAGDEF